MPPKAKEKFDAEMKRLSKLPENRVCADCPEKMPSYVNLTHRSFVCTTCSGIHRELQSKVKGVSMSSFSEEDIAAMTSGGNAVCNSTYLALYNNEVPMPAGTYVVILLSYFADLTSQGRDQAARVHPDEVRRSAMGPFCRPAKLP